MFSRSPSHFRAWRPAWRLGLAVSCLVHGLVLVVLAEALRSPPAESAGVTVAACFGAASTPAPAPLVRPTAATSDVRGPLVQAKLDAIVAEQQKRAPSEQLQRLDSVSAGLERVTSAPSLDELAVHFQSWLGYGSRAAEPHPRAAVGPFDFSTAQLHDVARYSAGAESWRYVSVLLDAQGRTMEVELSAEQGETLYELMQRIKANPLLEKIYRTIAMPLVDQLLRDTRAARR
jgi:hypothetical protein